MSQHDRLGRRDRIAQLAAYHRGTDDLLSLHGHGVAILTDEHGEVRHHVPFRNLITQVGDQYWAERAAGIASPPAQVTGMQLGTGTTAVAKTGAGAGIVTLVAASLVALDAGYPASSLASGARRITWQCQWAAGVATSDGIAEVALVNQSTGTQTVAPASATIARALLSTVVNKGASDTLTIVWQHDALGA